MKPAPFAYHAPTSLEQAVDLKSRYGDEAKFLAGGQSLVPAMNFRVVQPAVLIDLNRVPELAYITQDGESAASAAASTSSGLGAGLRIGAMTRERQLEIDPLIPARAPLLAEAIPHVAHPQIRNRGTLGGSLVNADPAAELPVIMVALGARLKVRSSRGERWVDARDFFLGMFSTDLAPEEILVEVELPPMPPRTGWSFIEVAPRHGDYALMGLAALVTLDAGGRIQHARLVYLNAGEGPVVAERAAQGLSGQAATEAVIEEAAELASREEIDPLGNIHATPEFQRHLAGVLTRRALQRAARRAEEAGQA